MHNKNLNRRRCDLLVTSFDSFDQGAWYSFDALSRSRRLRSRYQRMLSTGMLHWHRWVCLYSDHQIDKTAKHHFSDFLLFFLGMTIYIPIMRKYHTLVKCNGDCWWSQGIFMKEGYPPRRSEARGQLEHMSGLQP